MTEQPGQVIEEAVRLFETLREKMRGDDTAAGDVWSRAVREEHPPGTAECRYCPICRAIAAARESGPDVVGQVLEAGRSLAAALREAAAAYERTRSTPPRAGADGDPIDIG
ncbi:hypothetical protein DPM19_21680 [Actinomadura craniellae]|uniref:Uncharacterized protein n=1 Tax=Actinomadura craniellae TaxID=2231787 RepID=A0A365H1Y7_9ACTN|nr:hypothetical protein [Actinomadura craniellae]RAY13107.1 hypothetical protein DPM19_21680 [Actinomadura craniellae]